jgi:1,4-dihydroxy-2-naphthoate octaprenyltransferase
VWQYGLSALVAFLCPPALFLTGYGLPVLLPLVLLPVAGRLTQRLARSVEAQEQIALLGATARLLAGFGLLLSIGVVWGS